MCKVLIICDVQLRGSNVAIAIEWINNMYYEVKLKHREATPATTTTAAAEVTTYAKIVNKGGKCNTTNWCEKSFEKFVHIMIGGAGLRQLPIVVFINIHIRGVVCRWSIAKA